MMSKSLFAAVIAIIAACYRKCDAFSVSSTSLNRCTFSANSSSSNALHIVHNNPPRTYSGDAEADFGSSRMRNNRRDVLLRGMGSAFVALLSGGITTLPTDAAHASYSAYAAREKDWQERQKSGGETIMECFGLDRIARSFCVVHEVFPRSCTESLLNFR